MRFAIPIRMSSTKAVLIHHEQRRQRDDNMTNTANNTSNGLLSGIITVTAIVMIAAAPLAQAANSATWARGSECRAFRLGDVVQHVAGQERWVGVPVGELAECTTAYLVTEVRDGACRLSLVTSAGSPAESTEDGAVILVAEKRLTLQHDKSAFLAHLQAAKEEVTVEQKRNPFQVGDIAALNETSGYLVKVASGNVQDELQQHTPLYLVTEASSDLNTFVVSRIENDTEENSIALNDIQSR